MNDRWARPLSGEDWLALLLIWLSVFLVVVIAVRLYA